MPQQQLGNEATLFLIRSTVSSELYVYHSLATCNPSYPSNPTDIIGKKQTIKDLPLKGRIYVRTLTFSQNMKKISLILRNENLQVCDMSIQFQCCEKHTWMHYDYY